MSKYGMSFVSGIVRARICRNFLNFRKEKTENLVSSASLKKLILLSIFFLIMLQTFILLVFWATKQNCVKNNDQSYPGRILLHSLTVFSDAGGHNDVSGFVWFISKFCWLSWNGPSCSLGLRGWSHLNRMVKTGRGIFTVVKAVDSQARYYLGSCEHSQLYQEFQWFPPSGTMMAWEWEAADALSLWSEVNYHLHISLTTPEFWGDSRPQIHDFF